MIDPLAEVVTLLQPAARFSKVINGAGAWRVRRSEAGQPVYCVILEGTCRFAVHGCVPFNLQQGDFVLIPAAYDFSMSSLAPVSTEDTDAVPVALSNGEFRLGIDGEKSDVRFLVGHCVFGSPDAALLVSLLPQLVHVRGERKLATLVHLVSEESRERRPAREIVLARLLEVLLIEALRSTAGTGASPGLVRALADGRLANAIRGMHQSPTRPWTIAQLAKEATLSRSAFFERFTRALGVPPMEYLLTWRMALAKNFLMQKDRGIAEVAQRVGYSSASTFSVAFARHVGCLPRATHGSRWNLQACWWREADAMGEFISLFMCLFVEGQAPVLLQREGLAAGRNVCGAGCGYAGGPNRNSRPSRERMG